MNETSIEAEGLGKRFGGAEVLRDVDLRVRAGEIFALLGPNGAGKTTSVRILATLADADAGRARVAGADVRTERHLVRRRIALTGQSAALDELQTGRENLRMMGRLTRLGPRTARARAEELLERFDLVDAASRRVSTYSGGMCRRLDLAASLLVRPSVLFLDEPTTGLDPRSRQQMWAVVRDLAREGTTIFLMTQYLEEADQLADRIAVLDRGRLVAEGTAAELKARVAGFRLDLTAAGPTAYRALATALGARAVHAEPDLGLVGVAVTDDAAAIRCLLDELDPGRELVTRFAVHSVSLDDVFLALTGAGAGPVTDHGTESVHV
jgi:ABC-2 type transport system ATP-binding protein